MAHKTILLTLGLLFITFVAGNTNTSNTSDASSICYLPVYGRPQKNPTKSCPNTGLEVNDQCLPPCKAGYSENTAGDSDDDWNYYTFCWQNCPKGFDDVQGGCTHLTPFGNQYGGYQTKSACEDGSDNSEETLKNKCEQCHDTLWYQISSCGTYCDDYCPPTTCPDGMHKNKNGTICLKNHYNRTKPLFKLECSEGYEIDSDYTDANVEFCYQNPQEGFTCFGSVCTGTCPDGWQVCRTNICVEKSDLCDDELFLLDEDLQFGFYQMAGTVSLLSESDFANATHWLGLSFLPAHPICSY